MTPACNDLHERPGRATESTRRMENMQFRITLALDAVTTVVT